MSKLLRIGLTGGIGSGKSSVAARLVARGADLIDTDAIARQLTLTGGAAIAPLRLEFGPELIDADGNLDRQRMRDLAFADVTARKRLEGILHPLIGAQALQHAALSTSSVLVFDVPLLTESSHWRARCQRLLVVDCEEHCQVQRVIQRSGWPAEQVRAVIAQQASRVRRLAIADAVIFNQGIDLAGLDSAVARLWEYWCAGPVPAL